MLIDANYIQSGEVVVVAKCSSGIVVGGNCVLVLILGEVFVVVVHCGDEIIWQTVRFLVVFYELLILTCE